MIQLTKLFTRQHSIFYLYVWNNSDKLGVEKWLGFNIKHNLFLSEGASSKVGVWYDLTGPNILNIISNNINSDPLYFSNIEKDFYYYWNQIFPILKEGIKNAKDLENYFKLLVQWWTPMAVIVNIPDASNIPKNVLDGCVKMREETQEYSDRIDEIFIEAFSRIFPQYEKFKMVLTPEEIFNLKDKPLTDNQISEINKRLGGFFIFEGSLYTQDQLERVLGEAGVSIAKKVSTDHNELHGQVACKGTATGRVKLILLKNQISELQDGDVLVTEMTSPDFISAIKKSSAIITDEGGITSHAAIVSRELQKPCIIGVKIATQVLKDGDMVEVDADNGVVRIIK